MRHDMTHGGALDRIQAQFPDAPRPWIDLSTGINPWPYRGFTLDEPAFDRLPTESAYVACRDAMAEAFKAPARSVILSPGSELLIRLLPGCSPRTGLLCSARPMATMPRSGSTRDVR